MKKHGKKLIAPIIITALILLYYAAFAVVAIKLPLPIGWIIAGIVIPLCFAGVMIYVLIERIKEIRSGEEDDLSQY